MESPRRDVSQHVEGLFYQKGIRAVDKMAVGVSGRVGSAHQHRATPTSRLRFRTGRANRWAEPTLHYTNIDFALQSPYPSSRVSFAHRLGPLWDFDSHRSELQVIYAAPHT